MSNEQMARFISESRKLQNMTQKELAEKLNVTDKAVSKWERGLSYPDISLLTPLAEIFGVTTNELLNGQRNPAPFPDVAEPTDVNEVVENTLQYAKKASKSKRKELRSAAKLMISTIFLISIVVCVICNYAISKALTWSLYPISSIIFVWLTIIPLFQFEKKRILTSLSCFSLLIIPFLFTLDQILGSPRLFMPIGLRAAIIAILYLWIIYCLFSALKTRKWNASAISVLLAIPVSFIINLIVGKYLLEPFFDIWDLMTYGILILTALILFYISHFTHKENC